MMRIMTELFFWILCLAAFLQDLRTRYFSFWWLIPATAFLTMVPLQPGGSLLFCGFVFMVWTLKPDWIGMADVISLTFLSLVAGDSLYLLVTTACFLGLIWTWLKPDTLVPYVSCLSAAAMLLAVLV